MLGDYGLCVGGAAGYEIDRHDPAHGSPPESVALLYPNGGAVFSVGSCSWGGSLSHGGYDNDIYRITDNVLSGFLDRPELSIR